VSLTNTDSAVTILAGILIIIGVFGTVVPFIPGTIVSWLGVLIWAVFADRGPGKWVVLGIATAIALVGLTVRFLVPSRKMRRAGVSTWSLILGGLLSIIGFFAVPVVGLVLGFILGVFLGELIRLRDAGKAWPSTWHAIKAVGLSNLIEIGSSLFILVVWGAGLFLVSSST
jgi:uncharacterized protein YqgC (DUF456 family)